VALLVEGDDVVVKRLEVAVRDDGDSEGGVLAAVLGDALVVELLMACRRR